MWCLYKAQKDLFWYKSPLNPLTIAHYIVVIILIIRFLVLPPWKSRLHSSNFIYYWGTNLSENRWNSLQFLCLVPSTYARWICTLLQCTERNFMKGHKRFWVVFLCTHNRSEWAVQKPCFHLLKCVLLTPD